MTNRIITAFIFISVFAHCKEKPAATAAPAEPKPLADTIQVQDNMVTLTTVQATNAGIATGRPEKEPCTPAYR
ncbi:hypothetical protein [Paraflavitalea speifideaquila]|uniref:hypothetical protein n=1 Tax=Paraflavitalea speifideaquila TaxID=3076558 RepID=UPI0028E68009|nr:hypothetical protein [Paraflavitalea speifideiaquila]